MSEISFKHAYYVDYPRREDSNLTNVYNINGALR